MSFFQGISGIGVIGGMGMGLLSNYLKFPIDSHFPLVGLAMMSVLTFTLLIYVPYESNQDQQGPSLKLSNILILLAFMNFSLILSISSFISWSGVMLRDKFKFEDDLATFGTFGFVLAETGIRFWGDVLLKHFGKISLLIGTGFLTSVSLLSIYLIQHPIWALVSCVCVGLASGTIQPIIFGLSAEQQGVMARNMSFVMLFQSVAFLAGPLITGLIAQHVGLFEIYLFCSFVSATIVMFGLLLLKFEKTNFMRVK